MTDSQGQSRGTRPGISWPGSEWQSAPLPEDVDAQRLRAALGEIHSKPPELGVSLATLIVHRGVVVDEQYGPETDQDSTLISWSMAKTVTQAVVGMLVGDGVLDIDQPAQVPEFAGTSKSVITVRQLLEMRSGLEFIEDYVDDSTSHCLDMLFGAGMSDHAAYAANLPLIHEPGTVWNYASGTTNILARLAGNLIGGGRVGMEEFLLQRLFGPLGMNTAVAKFDEAGTLVGSSYVYATARDFARFGYLYLCNGVWNDVQLLPTCWVADASVVTSVDPEPPHFGYGQQCWIWRDYPGSIAAHGYEGQFIIVVPSRELVLVHLGKVPSEVRPALLKSLSAAILAFPEAA